MKKFQLNVLRKPKDNNSSRYLINRISVGNKKT